MEHHPTQTLTIETTHREQPDERIIRLSGPLTIHNFFDFQAITRQLPIPALTLVDMTEVPYIDSAALGSLVGLHVSCEKHARKYALINPNERVLNLFEMTQVRQFLVIYPTMEEAQAKVVGG